MSSYSHSAPTTTFFDDQGHFGDTKGSHHKMAVTTYPHIAPFDARRMLQPQGPPPRPLDPMAPHVYPSLGPVGRPAAQSLHGGFHAPQPLVFSNAPHMQAVGHASPVLDGLSHRFHRQGHGHRFSPLAYPDYGHMNGNGPRAQLVQSHPPNAQDVTADPIVPTYHGLIKTSTDAILLLSACDLATPEPDQHTNGRRSQLQPSPPPRRIHRRLLEHERPELIRPGSVFVWDEKEAGMRRWTDGRCWSASRVSGCFLTYRELEMRKRPSTDLHGPRANQYKIEGLIKQSFSITTGCGRKMHIVSYYTKRDLREGTLRRVSEDPRFVGEAGGEWGLSVDEEEYPDPVLASQEHSTGRVAEADGDDDSGNTSPVLPAAAPSVSAASARSAHVEQSTAPSEHGATSPQVRLAGLPNSSISWAERQSVVPIKPVPHAIPQTSSSSGIPRRSYSRDGLSSRGAPSESRQYDTRPPMKRKRSSSAGELYQSTASLPQLHLPEVSSLRLASHLLTESNVRGAQFGGQPSRRPKLSHPDASTPSPYTEQDSAAGALLSLRGTSYRGTISNSNMTPLTTPEDTSHETGTPKEALHLKRGNSGDGASNDRPKAPDRLPSDRDVLSKLHVRL